MSSPFWPQSKYAYRPRKNNMAPASFGSFGATPIPLPGPAISIPNKQNMQAGVVGGHYYPSQDRYGALSPDNWAVPKYVRTRDGLGDIAPIMLTYVSANAPVSADPTGCVDKIAKQIGSLGRKVAEKVPGVGSFLGGPAESAVAGLVNNSSAAAALRRLAAAYVSAGGTPAFSAALESDFLTLVARLVDVLPQAIKTPLVSFAGDSVAGLASYLRGTFSDWLNGLIKSQCGGDDDRWSGVGSASSSACNLPPPQKSGDACCGGIWLKYLNLCVLPHDERFSLLWAQDQALMAQEQGRLAWEAAALAQQQQGPVSVVAPTAQAQVPVAPVAPTSSAAIPLLAGAAALAFLFLRG